MEARIMIGNAEVDCGVVSIFNVNQTTYAALIPIDEEFEPLNTDAILLICEGNDEEGYTFYDIKDKKEYELATLGFQAISKQFGRDL